MKILLLIFTLVTGSVWADVHRQTTLDLSNLYNGFDAGIYQYDVKLISSGKIVPATVSKHRTQDDAMIFCTTTVSFEVGTIEVTLTKDNWSKKETYPVKAVMSETSEDSCAGHTVEQRSGNTKVSLVFSNKTIELPVNAPARYSKINGYITPFRGRLTSSAVITHDGKQFINSSEVLNEETLISLNQQIDQYQYYITATNSDNYSTLSLGTGVRNF